MALIKGCLSVLMVLGLLIFVGSLTMYFLFPEMISQKVKEVRVPARRCTQTQLPKSLRHLSLANIPPLRVH